MPDLSVGWQGRLRLLQECSKFAAPYTIQLISHAALHALATSYKVSMKSTSDKMCKSLLLGQAADLAKKDKHQIFHVQNNIWIMASKKLTTRMMVGVLLIAPASCASSKISDAQTLQINQHKKNTKHFMQTPLVWIVTWSQLLHQALGFNKPPVIFRYNLKALSSSLQCVSAITPPI